MVVECVWEHNGSDTLLYAVNPAGAYARGENCRIAMEKMRAEVSSFLKWKGEAVPEKIEIAIVQDAPCDLQVCDADSDVLFAAEQAPLSIEEYRELKELALKSAADFLALYTSIPDKHLSDLPARRSFYGQVPRTAEEMYTHTKNVNAYYFGEIGVEGDNAGSILDCRARGFALLEAREGFLENPVVEGSYGELWSLRKVLRRFLWHDRIHARAMYRLGVSLWGPDGVENPFCF